MPFERNVPDVTVDRSLQMPWVYDSNSIQAIRDEFPEARITHRFDDVQRRHASAAKALSYSLRVSRGFILRCNVTRNSSILSTTVQFRTQTEFPLADVATE